MDACAILQKSKAKNVINPLGDEDLEETYLL